MLDGNTWIWLIVPKLVPSNSMFTKISSLILALVLCTGYQYTICHNSDTEIFYITKLISRICQIFSMTHLKWSRSSVALFWLEPVHSLVLLRCDK
jgi:hypothetical protein